MGSPASWGASIPTLRRSFGSLLSSSDDWPEWRSQGSSRSGPMADLNRSHRTHAGTSGLLIARESGPSGSERRGAMMRVNRMPGARIGARQANLGEGMDEQSYVTSLGERAKDLKANRSLHDGVALNRSTAHPSPDSTTAVSRDL
jgi:hypothetical protein